MVWKCKCASLLVSLKMAEIFIGYGWDFYSPVWVWFENADVLVCWFHWKWLLTTDWKCWFAGLCYLVGDPDRHRFRTDQAAVVIKLLILEKDSSWSCYTGNAGLSTHLLCSHFLCSFSWLVQQLSSDQLSSDNSVSEFNLVLLNRLKWTQYTNYYWTEHLKT